MWEINDLTWQSIVCSQIILPGIAFSVSVKKISSTLMIHALSFASKTQVWWRSATVGSVYLKFLVSCGIPWLHAFVAPENSNASASLKNKIVHLIFWRPVSCLLFSQQYLLLMPPLNKLFFSLHPRIAAICCRSDCTLISQCSFRSWL